MLAPHPRSLVSCQSSVQTVFSPLAFAGTLRKTHSVSVQHYDAFRHHSYKCRRRGVMVRRHNVEAARLQATMAGSHDGRGSLLFVLYAVSHSHHQYLAIIACKAQRYGAKRTTLGGHLSTPLSRKQTG